MKHLLIFLTFSILIYSCKEKVENEDGIIESFDNYIDYAYLDLERHLVNKVVTCKIKYQDENVNFNGNNEQIEKSTLINTYFERINLNQVFINDKESNLWDSGNGTNYFTNGALNEDSLLKFNNFNNKIDLQINDELKNLNFNLSEPVKFKNLFKGDKISSNSNFTINWNSNVSQFAKLEITNSNFQGELESYSWLIPNTGSITISKKILKDLNKGTYIFEITRYDFIPLEIEESKNCLIEFESTQSISVEIE